MNFAGYNIVIEHRAGTIRRGVDKNGNPWERELTCHYGYLEATEGIDGENIDVFIVPNPNDSDELTYWSCHVVDQVKPDTAAFDEHKLILNAADIEDAKRSYLSNYPEDWKGLGAIAELSGLMLSEWLKRMNWRGLPYSLNYTSPIEDRPNAQGESGAYDKTVDPVCPDCGTAYEWGGDKCNRCGSTRPPVIPSKGEEAEGDGGGQSTCVSIESPGEEVAAVDVETEERDIFSHDAPFEIVSDAGKPLRVKQLATIADAINGNNRIYPRSVLEKAIVDARPRAKAGAMLSEFFHPSVVEDSEGPKYVDNPDAKTARVDDILDITADGKVYVIRTFLDTPYGLQVASDMRAKKPSGISVRWKMRGHFDTIDGKRVHVADKLHFLTVDDVPNPAVTATRYDFHLLTDEMRAQLGLPAAEQADEKEYASALSDERPKQTETGKPRKETRMNDKIKRMLGNYAAKIAARAESAALESARKMVSDAIEEANVAGEDVLEATAALSKVDAMTFPTYAGGSGVIAVPGNATGTNIGGGWGASVEKGAETPKETTPSNPDAATDASAKKENATPAADVLSEEDRNALKAFLTEKATAAADAKRKGEIKAAIDAARDTALAGLEPDVATFLAEKVEQMASDAAAVPGLLAAEVDAYGKLAARERLKGQGFPGATTGTTVTEPGRGRIEAGEDRPPAYMESVEKLLAAADETARHQGGFGISPDSSLTQSIRKHNRPIIEAMVREWNGVRQRAKNPSEWAAMVDNMGDGEQALFDSIRKAGVAYDATTVSNMYNQPVISTALLIQSFQDMQALQFADVVGPGADQASSPNSPHWQLTGNSGGGNIGAFLRIPVEYYTAPTGYGASGPQDDLGLLVPESTGIDEATVNTVWLPFAPSWRRIAAFPTRDVIVAMGAGPLNYPVVGRHIFHMGFDKQRRMDQAILNEIVDISDEYGAVAVSAETQNLTYNSVYAASGSVTVNLNTTKAASATVAATDPSVTYGATVLAAVRLTTGGSGSSSPYSGTADGVTPVCRPRTVVDLTAAGAVSSSTANAISVSAPGSAVRGYLDASGDVASFVGTTATYAVDYNNGVICFASGVSGSSGIATTTVTCSYSYVTNFDNFVVNNPTLATGETPSAYYNRLFAQFDTTAASMGSASRYVKPDTALMSLKASTWLTQAQIFYRDQSPNGTNFFPTESYFAERTGIGMARLNAPWRVGDTRIHLFRKGSTKYGIQVPYEVRGPFPKYDSNGKLVSAEGYYGEEFSVVCTPQVKNQAGTILNPVGRHIRLR